MASNPWGKGQREDKNKQTKNIYSTWRELTLNLTSIGFRKCAILYVTHTIYTIKVIDKSTENYKAVVRHESNNKQKKDRQAEVTKRWIKDCRS